MTSPLNHSFAFDPSYGYSLETLLTVPAPQPVADYVEFWQTRYSHALQVQPQPQIHKTGEQDGFEVHDISYTSTDGFTIWGWLLLPKDQPVTCAMVIGHGYGGREAPDFHWKIPGAALLFPCFRGLSRSQRAPISNNPAFHVLHDIDKPAQYILGGCVEDVWLAVSALITLFPNVQGRIGYAGISFGGGIGAMAMAWDERIQRGHLNVPTFGNQPLRLQLPTIGSGEAVRIYQRRRGNVLVTLQYYDAAIAAGFIHQPMHIAAALFDPAVAPPGQFAIYNAILSPKTLFVLEAGHFDYPNQAQQARELQQQLEEFFAVL